MSALKKLRSVAGAEAPADSTTSIPAAVDPHKVEVIADGPLPAGIVEESNVPATRTVDSGAIAPRPGAMTFAASTGIEGDWDASDVKFPAVKIVQGSGELSQRYNMGSVILGDEELLPSPDLKMPRPEHVFRFVPVVLTKQFRENLSKEEADSGAMPRIVNSLAEVEALGGTTQWINDVKPSWSPSARILLLVERPENLPGSGSDHPGFALEIGGKLYAPAVYYASGSSYTSLAKTLFNATLTTLQVVERGADGQPVKGPTGVIRRIPYLPKAFWTWRTVRRAAGEYTVFAPEVRLTREDTSDELRGFIDTLRG